jgi:hypothetical protein
MTEPSRQVSSPRLGRDGRPVKPSSISTAVVLGFVQVGLSVLATVGMIVLVLALASVMEVGTGGEVWLIAVVPLTLGALAVIGVVHAARPSSSEYLRIMRDW